MLEFSKGVTETISDETAMKRIGVIGAGPAGMAAALEAARQGAAVLLFDSNPRLGRKLMTTGSGRGNLTNHGVCAERYATSNHIVLDQALSRFNPGDLIEWLAKLGIPTYATQDGWVYPLSNAAANVVDIFEARLQQAGVTLHLRTLIRDIIPATAGINPKGKRYELVEPDRSRIHAVDRVIVATGGKAAPKSGSRGELLPILARLGHTILPVYPALAPLLTDRRPLHKLQGVRLDARLALSIGETRLGETTGNIIFTEWGINGPGVMDLSHLAGGREGQPLRLTIDFLHAHQTTLERLLDDSQNLELPLQAALEAVLPAKVAALFRERAGLPAEVTLRQLTSQARRALLQDLMATEVAVIGTRGFEFCQASSGGVALEEIDPETMESRLRRGLYIAGELLDVVGPCGGYNLHWAFTSGRLAGIAAGAES
ncbi:MAG: aminoacetone oxidase family FAD-binding enzyme [Anaerolineaceae bacterium]|nr:aminoacetone oxidase family FAD-binding enzyme [Anaerolineaceae bacterium]